MRLSHLLLAGFKSFAHPTRVEFSTNMAGIVGPNGCGKSNIVDAIRWVLGESSAKQLRGGSMSDVIFAGSEGQKAHQRASVELVFADTEGRLPNPYHHCTQLSVKREVTLSGDSNYYLNGTRCRRRDITDIFLGTGLGPRSYAIIRQETASRLIDAKPEELRVYFEELSGVAKYHDRRDEALGRMQKTRDNLERLLDQVHHFEHMAKRLERQAKEAERYQEEKSLLHQKKRVLAEQTYYQREHTYQALSAKCSRLKEKLEQVQIDHAQAQEKYDSAQARLESLREQMEVSREQRHTYQQRHEREQTRRAYLEQQHTQWSEEYQQTQENKEMLQERLSVLQNQQQSLQEQEERARKTTEQRLQEYEASQTQLMAAEQGLKTQQAAQASAQRQCDESRMSEQLLENKKQHTQTLLFKIEEELKSYEQQLSALSLDTQQSHCECLMAAFQQAQEILTLRGREHQEAREVVEALSQQVESGRIALAEIAAVITELSKQQYRLQAEQDVFESRLSKDVPIPDLPRVLSQLTVSARWRLALEHVLSEALNGLCSPVDVWESAWGEQPLPLFWNVQDPLPQISEGTLAHEVTGAPCAMVWVLQQIHLVENTEQALASAKQANWSESFITPEGFWCGKGWAKPAVSIEGAGVLDRQAALVKLSEQLEDKQQDYAAAQEAQLSAQAQCDEAKVVLEHKQKALSSARQECYQHQAEQSAATKALELQRQQQAHYQSRLEALQQEQVTLQQHLVELDAQALSAEQHEQYQELLLTATADGERLLVECAQQKTHCQERQQCYEEALSASREARQALNLLEKDRVHVTERLERTTSRLTVLLESKPASGEVDTTEDLSELQAACQACEARLSALQEEYQSVTETHVMLSSRLAALVEEEKQLVGKAASLEVQCEQHQSQQTLATEAYVSTYHQPFPEHIELLSSEEREALSREITALETSLLQMGAINFAALEELASIEGERESLASQVSDLETALAHLQEAIDKIDEDTQAQFMETYNKVNAEFTRLFSQIFSGGQGGLALVGEDPLTSGVLIKAQPPGKRNHSLSSLSGGEKTLTAIALVFALFSLNPAPFCVLDEIDAPLDDANVLRFLNLVKTLVDKTQFILITHSKPTMESMDQLIGVTMHEAGISRIVSVNVQHCMELVNQEE